MSKKSLSNYNFRYYHDTQEMGFEIEDDEADGEFLASPDREKPPKRGPTEVVSARVPVNIAKTLKSMNISPSEAFKTFCENELIPKKKCPRCGQDIKG